MYACEPHYFLHKVYQQNDPLAELQSATEEVILIWNKWLSSNYTSFDRVIKDVFKAEGLDFKY